MKSVVEYEIGGSPRRVEYDLYALEGQLHVFYMRGSVVLRLSASTPFAMREVER